MMSKKKSIIDLIKARSSWRKYLPLPLEDPIKTQVNKKIKSLQSPPFGSKVRFHLVENTGFSDKGKVKLGTYGFISGARSFIVGTVNEGLHNLEDYGFLMEELILYLTEINLGTCWLGGTFKRSEFASIVSLEKGETIPAVTPVGYPTDQRGFKDKLIRTLAGSRSRKNPEELFFEESCSNPLSLERAEGYENPIEMVRLAPSASNLQPWRILKDGCEFHFLIKRKRNYDKAVKNIDLQRIDMGIAMCHFELTAREINLKGEWVVLEKGLNFPWGMEYVVTWISKP
jgi:nitroreductase